MLVDEQQGPSFALFFQLAQREAENGGNSFIGFCFGKQSENKRRHLVSEQQSFKINQHRIAYLFSRDGRSIDECAAFLLTGENLFSEVCLIRRHVSWRPLRFICPVQKWSDNASEWFQIDQKRIMTIGTWQLDKRNMLAHSEQF